MGGGAGTLSTICQRTGMEPPEVGRWHTGSAGLWPLCLNLPNTHSHTLTLTLTLCLALPNTHTHTDTLTHTLTHTHTHLHTHTNTHTNIHTHVYTHSKARIPTCTYRWHSLISYRMRDRLTERGRGKE